LVGLATSPEQNRAKIAAEIAFRHLRATAAPRRRAYIEEMEGLKARGFIEEYDVPKDPFLSPEDAQPDELKGTVQFDPSSFELLPRLGGLLRLFRTGVLKASANLPGDPRAYEISRADWAGLEMSDTGRGRLGVWRIGSRGKTEKGDFEDVRIERELVLKVFPAKPAEDVAVEMNAGFSPRSASSPGKAKPREPEAAAQALIRLFPDGRPPLSRSELCRELQRRAPELGSISDSTIKRAITLAWPTAGSNRVK